MILTITAIILNIGALILPFMLLPKGEEIKWKVISTVINSICIIANTTIVIMRCVI